MLIIVCPFCGKRPEIEFSYGGEAHIARPAESSAYDDARWAEFLYMRNNTKGLYAERWRHSHGCGRFFNALRDTTTDHFTATYRVGEPRPDLASTASSTAPSTEPSAAPAAAGPGPAGSGS